MVVISTSDYNFKSVLPLVRSRFLLYIFKHAQFYLGAKSSRGLNQTEKCVMLKQDITRIARWTQHFYSMFKSILLSPQINRILTELVLFNIKWAFKRSLVVLKILKNKSRWQGTFGKIPPTELDPGILNLNIDTNLHYF